MFGIMHILHGRMSTYLTPVAYICGAYMHVDKTDTHTHTDTHTTGLSGHYDHITLVTMAHVWRDFSLPMPAGPHIVSHTQCSHKQPHTHFTIYSTTNLCATINHYFILDIPTYQTKCRFFLPFLILSSNFAAFPSLITAAWTLWSERSSKPSAAHTATQPPTHTLHYILDHKLVCYN